MTARRRRKPREIVHRQRWSHAVAPTRGGGGPFLVLKRTFPYQMLDKTPHCSGVDELVLITVPQPIMWREPAGLPKGLAKTSMDRRQSRMS